MATTKQAKPVVIAVIVEGRIETGLIWGHCPWPNKHFPFGFEYSFESLILKKIDECEDKGDVGLMLLNPDADNPYVTVRVMEDDRHLNAEQRRAYDDEDGTVRVPFGKCVEWLGVSHFKLMDLLLERRKAEIDAAFDEIMSARAYETVTMTMTGDKYSEKREKAPQ